MGRRAELCGRQALACNSQTNYLQEQVRAKGSRMQFTNKLCGRKDLVCKITFKLNETALFLQATDVCAVSAASATAANAAATVSAATTVPADTTASASKPD